MEYAPTVFVVEDHDGVRDALCLLLNSVKIRAHGFATAREFLEHYSPGLRGCLIVDVRMPGMSGLELQEALLDLHSHLPVIVTTAHADIHMAVRAMRAGAFDFLEKPVNEQVLLERIQQALELDAKQYEKQAYRDGIRRRVASLTPREQEVLKYLVDGKSTKQIADAMRIKNKTVETHRASVFEKMHARNLAELTHMIVGCELLEGDPPPSS